MKMLFARICFAATLAGAVPGGAALAEPVDGASGKAEDSTDFYDARGRLIGSRTRIGDASYLTAPDGRVIGVSTTVAGRRVFRSY
jgi:hypothetical protein